jgi:5-carboxymethyl-2-hydroxymuconate isomerase
MNAGVCEESLGMPHIVVEATPKLARAIDFVPLFARIHHRISEQGTALLDDFKSRVVVADRHLAGVDPDAEFIVARLITTNPRPPEIRRAMAAVIHEIMSQAVAAEPRPYWWQCYVLIEAFDKADYLKTDSHG